MNTTVHLTEPLNLGAGAEDRVTFPNCRWHADEGGSLHIIREGGRGTAMSFAAASWLYVTDGGGIAATEGKR
jgi:hypothetical protein